MPGSDRARRGDRDHAADRLAAVERGLAALQHLDPADVVDEAARERGRHLRGGGVGRSRCRRPRRARTAAAAPRTAKPETVPAGPFCWTVTPGRSRTCSRTNGRPSASSSGAGQHRDRGRRCAPRRTARGWRTARSGRAGPAGRRRAGQRRERERSREEEERAHGRLLGRWPVAPRAAGRLTSVIGGRAGPFASDSDGFTAAGRPHRPRAPRGRMGDVGAGLLARGSGPWRPPSREMIPSGVSDAGSPLTVAGAAAGWGNCPAPRSLSSRPVSREPRRRGQSSRRRGVVKAQRCGRAARRARARITIDTEAMRLEFVKTFSVRLVAPKRATRDLADGEARGTRSGQWAASQFSPRLLAGPLVLPDRLQPV